MDLVALNLQRGRDHGLAPYLKWRDLCGLSSVNGWKDLTNVVSSPEVGYFLFVSHEILGDILLDQKLIGWSFFS